MLSSVTSKDLSSLPTWAKCLVKNCARSAGEGLHTVPAQSRTRVFAKTPVSGTGAAGESVRRKVCSSARTRGMDGAHRKFTGSTIGHHAGCHPAVPPSARGIFSRWQPLG